MPYHVCPMHVQARKYPSNLHPNPFLYDTGQLVYTFRNPLVSLFARIPAKSPLAALQRNHIYPAKVRVQRGSRASRHHHAHTVCSEFRGAQILGRHAQQNWRPMVTSDNTRGVSTAPGEHSTATLKNGISCQEQCISCMYHHRQVVHQFTGRGNCSCVYSGAQKVCATKDSWPVR